MALVTVLAPDPEGVGPIVATLTVRALVLGDRLAGRCLDLLAAQLAFP